MKRRRLGTIYEVEVRQDISSEHNAIKTILVARARLRRFQFGNMI